MASKPRGMTEGLGTGGRTEAWALGEWEGLGKGEGQRYKGRVLIKESWKDREHSVFSAPQDVGCVQEGVSTCAHYFQV